MKITRIAVILLLGILLVSGFACCPEGAGPVATPTPTPTPTATPTPLPTVTMSCEQARDAIQVALDDYYAEHGQWPTADGQPGDIQWAKLVPDFMTGVPSNDSSCEWGVNSEPEGEVCLQHLC